MAVARFFHQPSSRSQTVMDSGRLAGYCSGGVSVGDFRRAVGTWWLGALLLLLLLLVGIAGAVVLKWGAVLAAVGMVIVLVGAYRAYHRIAQERDQPRSRPEPDHAGFTVNAGAPYAAIPSGLNSLIIPDVAVVNWSDTPIDLRFTLLAADGSGPIESVFASSRAVSVGLALSNPMHLGPRSSRNGRLIWVHGGGDATQYVTVGAVLRVLEESTEVFIDIGLSNAGFEYPTPTQS